MKRFILISTIAAGLSIAPHAFGQQAAPEAEGISKKDHDTTEMHASGIDGSYGKFQGTTQSGVGLQGMSVTITNAPGATNTYGAGHGSLDLSLTPGASGFALNAEEKSGVNLWTRKSNEAVIPLIGLEPLNLMFGTSVGFDKKTTTHTGVLGQTYTTQDSDPHRIQGREPNIEWSPMASAGVQLFSDTCKATLLIRGGASIGTLGDGGVRPAYGAGVTAVCKDLLQFSADVMRIPTKTVDVDMASLRAFVLIPGQKFGVGTVFDARDAKDVSQSSAVYSLPTPASATGEFVGKVVIGGKF